MDPVAIPPPTRRFFGDAGSLRSFRGNPPSNPPSLKTSSLKGKRSMTMPSILSLKRGLQGESTNVRGETKNMDFNPNGPTLIISEKQGEPSSPLRRKSLDVENKTQPTGASPLQRPRSKSRTIIRMISTKFRSRSPTPSPVSPRVPAAPTDFASKENREAALRERGLLPPLMPKDLSLLELEQDRHIPVLTPAGEENTSGDAATTLTAATLVKQEWVAKNRSTALDLSQRERMNTFKFGGSSSAPATTENISQPTGLDTVQEVDSPLPSPLSAKSEEHPSVDGGSEKPQASGSSPSLRGIGTPEAPGTTARIENGPFISERSATPLNLEPYLIPLPETPKASKSPQRPRAKTVGSDTDSDVIYGFEASIPLPPSPSMNGVPDSPSSPLPAISLSPPIAPSITQQHFPSRSRSLSFPPLQSVYESGSESNMTPSLDTSSQTMTISTLSTSESSPVVGRVKANALRVKVHEQHIPIIVESPIEESLFKGSITNMDLVDEPDSNEHVIASDDDDDEPPQAQARPRVVTDPTSLKPAKPERRKSLNPFKRGQTVDSSSPPPTINRRISVSASFSNMRRSVVGSLSRPKPIVTTGITGQKTFDASHLPPSPTIPASFAKQALTSPTRSLFPSSHSPPPTSLHPRQAVSPTLHSRGSILIEASHIEDEESRRMTELAFLG